jgi:hypothetical protein
MLFEIRFLGSNKFSFSGPVAVLPCLHSSPVVRSAMSEVVYVSKIRIERKKGALRIAYLPGESQPVSFSVHGAIAKHYRVDPAKIGESHAATINYVIASTAG